MVDIENVVGEPQVARVEVERVMKVLTSVLDESTQYVLGASHSRNAFEAGLACPGRRVIWSPGKDGADRALQSEITNPTTLRQFGHLIVVSGDGGFADAIALAARVGLRTTVLSRAAALSPKLRLAAHQVLTFPDTANDYEVA
ncbi:NYN domain-containing protein [Gordonia rubripertincta]|uniref:NYN domain-containing protein n=1 Tax=Gordonia rubripertincta TaxID=36822 RepID=UPI00163DC08E|nr:NYN domain-containing protein [Gordonia rubripertincta]